MQTKVTFTDKLHGYKRKLEDDSHYCEIFYTKLKQARF